MRGTGISRFGSRATLAVLALLLLGALVAAGCGTGGEDTTTTTTISPGTGEQSTTTASSVPTGSSETLAAVEVMTTTTTEPTTTTTELTTTTTGVQVTHESGRSLCYIKKIFRSGGKDYIVVDYVILQGPEDSFKIINNNPRLRTFEIPKDAWIGFNQLAEDLGIVEYNPPSARGVRVTLAELKRAYRLTDMFWDIKVSDGKVISIVEGWLP